MTHPTEELEIPREQSPETEGGVGKDRDVAAANATENDLDLKALSQALEPRSAVTLLSKLGLSDTDVANGVGASDRTVRRWRSADDTSVRRYGRQIDDLRALVALLREEGTLPDPNIVYWLRARNRDLDDERPLDRLREGDFEAVRAAALALVGN